MSLASALNVDWGLLQPRGDFEIIQEHCAIACCAHVQYGFSGDKHVITPPLVQYPIYMDLAFGPAALGLGACISDIALTRV